MNWNWSFRAFRLFGTDVRIHWSLPAFFLFFVLRAAQHGASPTFLGLFVITPFVLLFSSVLAHEYGHIFAARYYGLTVGHTILTPIGGMVMVGRARSPRAEFVVAMSGPGVNLALALLGSLLFIVIGGWPPASMLIPFVTDEAFGGFWSGRQLGLLMLYDFVQMNMMLLMFNVVMVAYPMDGGRALMAALWKTRGYRPAIIMSCKVSRVVAVLLVVAAIISFSPMLGIIAVFLWVQASATLRQAPMLTPPGPDYSRAARKKKTKPKSNGGGLGGWLEQKRMKRYVELLAKAEANGLHGLTRKEREFLKRSRKGK